MLVSPFKHQELANKILESWDDICKELNIPHLLIYGTALGFYRDNGYIESDNDVDLRLICNKKKWKEFQKLFIERNSLNANDSSGTSYVTCVDGGHLLFCVERSPLVGLVIHDTGHELLVPPCYYKFDIVEHNGRKYCVPHPIEEYLEIRYGADWRIPNPKWDKKIGKPRKLTL